MSLTRREGLRLAGAAAASAILSGSARADAWPTRPVKTIIPFTAGATVDIVGRIVLDPLSAQLGQPIVVENRGGAGGSIGTAVVAKAEPTVTPCWSTVRHIRRRRRPIRTALRYGK